MLHIYHFLYFFHSPFFFYRQYMGYHQTIHRWKYILKMADHRFLLQHFSPSQSPAAPLCNDQTSCICKTKGLWWKKTLVSFTRGQKGAKCGTLTAKNTSTCSVAMDPTSLVTGTRWGTLRSRTSLSGWTHPPRNASRARRRTRAGGWARGGGADGAERHSYWTWHCYGWGVKTTWTWRRDELYGLSVRLMISACRETCGHHSRGRLGNICKGQIMMLMILLVSVLVLVSSSFCVHECWWCMVLSDWGIYAYWWW